MHEKKVNICMQFERKNSQNMHEYARNMPKYACNMPEKIKYNENLNLKTVYAILNTNEFFLVFKGKIRKKKTKNTKYD